MEGGQPSPPAYGNCFIGKFELEELFTKSVAGRQGAGLATRHPATVGARLMGGNVQAGDVRFDFGFMTSV
jgi:hypothetical protein